jgi:hypothetical protein
MCTFEHISSDIEKEAHKTLDMFKEVLKKV